MSDVRHDQVRQIVRQQYSRVAESSDACCSSAPSCCGTSSPEAVSQALGYSAHETAAVPDGANMGLGCGNPQAIAALKPGETVLDLGSGGGFDCFLAARQVGAAGRVIGVDMTPAMLSKARANAEQGGYANVEFRLGEIEHLPVADRVGRRDPLQLRDQPVARQAARVRASASACSSPAAGSRSRTSSRSPTSRRTSGKTWRCSPAAWPARRRSPNSARCCTRRGFEDVRIAPKEESKSFIREWAPGTPVTDYVVAATIEAVKPVA